jgi:two-component system LytT family response regulator
MARERITALVVDDEPLARETLRLLLQRDPEIQLSAACDGPQAAAAIREHGPDILFLDVQMPGRGGFDVLEEVGPEAVKAVVFVTAYDRYALRAFDAHAVDYLLKPFDDERFERALSRAKERVRSREVGQGQERILALLESMSGPGEGIRRFMVRTTDRLLVVKAEEVDWIGAADDYSELHVGQRTHLVRQTMQELESGLDARAFARIHRSTIVNLDRVRELHPQVKGDSEIVLQDGTVLRLSRTHRASFELRLREAGRSPVR